MERMAVRPFECTFAKERPVIYLSDRVLAVVVLIVSWALMLWVWWQQRRARQ